MPDENTEKPKILDKLEQHSPSKAIVTILFVILIVAVTVFFVVEYVNGKFNDVDSLREFVDSFGFFGPAFLTFFQCIKVIYGIIPGAIGCIVGAGLFGTVKGFICSYIGICAGSIFAFLLSRRFGVSIIQKMFKEKRYNSCIRWMEKWHKSYPVFLWIAICLPISPDDFLCYFTGLTTMSFKKFVIILLTAKIWTILGYSLIFGNVI